MIAWGTESIVRRYKEEMIVIRDRRTISQNQLVPDGCKDLWAVGNYPTVKAFLPNSPAKPAMHGFRNIEMVEVDTKILTASLPENTMSD